MKVFAATALLALAASTQSASAASCLLNLGALTTALEPIVADAYECQTKTGFEIVPPSKLPTATQLTAICTQCTKLIAGAKTVKFPDCTFPIDGKEIDIATLFNQIVGQCATTGGSAAETGAANSTAPAANTTAPAPTTTAPATTAPATEGSAGSAGKEVSSATVETPAPTTKAPAATTAAPKSAAAGVSATVGAAVAVAFSVAALVL